ncbi:uncharacterized protein PGTG_15864 [Puccinia graminis f. sp. tritici CRL 75-36-700-3]|uniref:Uncharacterized protein n=1 Tax=Puccinia graminis f. sp. tritici (strain CRL 75-36-700-3 / race SCCL) TaxID=418459 RepID=E3L0K3_PUCGT|nr:uncharacterized protein PGTG_15864 [Puccinia graminis f. sp. tritici CRL 75-36-700-3]EFP90016.2 hypothetical protein PGTG_15864 [Puccinia graminis f. sp. tritici CRL 75-36-700-3]
MRVENVGVTIFRRKNSDKCVVHLEVGMGSGPPGACIGKLERHFDIHEARLRVETSLANKLFSSPISKPSVRLEGTWPKLFRSKPNTAPADGTRGEKTAFLIAGEFRRLQKYDFSWPTDTEDEASIERLRPKKDLLIRLDSDLLPSINEQCSRLAGLLRDPPDLGEDPASIFKIISEIQANLHRTLPQTIQTLNELFPTQTIQTLN